MSSSHPLGCQCKPPASPTPSDFTNQLIRLKRAVGLSKDCEISTLLGMTKSAFSERKRRGAFPVNDLVRVANQRSDLGLNVNAILTGSGTTGSRSMSARQPTDAEVKLIYALSRQVPDMERGFVIGTAYGQVEVVAGPLAEALRDLVRESLQRELASLEQAE